MQAMQRLALILVCLFTAATKAIAVDVDDFVEKSYQGYPSRLFIPLNYDPEDETTTYPLVVFLHGLGERGDDNRKQFNNDEFLVFVNEVNQTAHPCFLLAPQCPTSTVWQDLGTTTDVKDMIDDLIAEYPAVDQDRLIMTGLSLGGMGTIKFAKTFPDRLAVAIPVCGSGLGDTDASHVPHIAWWFFHGENDSTVAPSNSINATNYLRKHGGRPFLTLYPGVGHNSWSRAYNEPPLVDWAMAQRRNQPLAGLPILNIQMPTSEDSLISSTLDIDIGGEALVTTGVTAGSVAYTLQTADDGDATGFNPWSATISVEEGDDRLNVIATTTTEKGGNLTFSDTLAITASPSANEPPVATASASHESCASGTQVTLSGSGSTDPDSGPSPLTYTWAQSGGNPEAVALTDLSGNNMDVSCTPVVAGSYSFTLTVSDGADSDTDDVTVLVTAEPDGALAGDGDFGNVLIDGSATRTFTITSNGSAELTLTGSPLVEISGPDAALFSVTFDPAATVTPGASTTFEIEFSPLAAATATAALSISTNDGTLTTALSGSGVEEIDAATLPPDDDDDDGCGLHPGAAPLLPVLISLLLCFVRRKRSQR